MVAKLKDGDKVKYKDLPMKSMFLAGPYLCLKISEVECFIFQSYSEVEITDPDAIVEYKGSDHD